MEHHMRHGREETLNAPARPAADPVRFITANTELLPVPLANEIRLHLASEAFGLWHKSEEELGEIGLPPPFWAFAWAGGQALARYLLDHAETVRGKRVLDLGSGSGLTAIAAAKAGANLVEAAEIDTFALAAIGLNMAANHVTIALIGRDVLCEPLWPADTILVGDLFYEKPLAERVLAFVRRQQGAGAEILIGDPGRSYLPRERLEKIAEYSVPVSRELEDMEIKKSAVWRLARADAGRTEPFSLRREPL